MPKEEEAGTISEGEGDEGGKQDEEKSIVNHNDSVRLQFL
jgi:hypothetical protein